MTRTPVMEFGQRFSVTLVGAGVNRVELGDRMRPDFCYCSMKDSVP